MKRKALKAEIRRLQAQCHFNWTEAERWKNEYNKLVDKEVMRTIAEQERLYPTPRTWREAMAKLNKNWHRNVISDDFCDTVDLFMKRGGFSG